MTPSELRILEKEFGVAFPDWYRKFVCEFPKQNEYEEFCTTADGLRTNNASIIQNGAWGFDWKPEYWATGDDGCGGIYFIDTSSNDDQIFYIDHEMPPTDIDDERLTADSSQEFLKMLLELERDFQLDCKRMRERVAKRQWWQFWIPMNVPRWAASNDADANYESELDEDSK